MARIHKLSPDTLAVVYLVKLVALAAHEPAPSAHLDHLAFLALEATLGEIESDNLEKWLAKVAGDSPTEAQLQVVKDIRDQVHTVKQVGLDGAVSWIHGEIKPLMAWSDEDEMALSTHPAPLLRASPLGIYLRRTYMSIGKLSFDQACEWWDRVEAWCDGRKEDVRGRKGEKGDDVAESFVQARLRQDYHASQDLVRSFSTSDGQNGINAEQALLHLALVEFEDGGFEAAEQALNEAIQIARTVGDVDCLSDCSSLEQRLKVAAASSGRSSSAGLVSFPSFSTQTAQAKASNPNAPHDILHSASTSLPSLFPHLYTAQAIQQHHLFPPFPTASSASVPPPVKKEEDVRPLLSEVQKGAEGEWSAAWAAVMGEVWDEMAIASLASIHDSIALSFLDWSRPDWDLKLSVLRRQALRLPTDSALALLLRAVDTREKRNGMGVEDLARWKAVVEEVLTREDTASKADNSLPLHTQLSRTLTIHQTALMTHHEHSRLSSLIELIDLRLSLADAKETAEAERGLEELEREWGAVLAFARHEGEGEGRERLARAKELKARCLVLAGRAEDSQVLAAIELLEDALADSSSPQSRLRILSTLAHLSSHLCTPSSSSSSLPPTALGHWLSKRDEYARRWLELSREVEGGEKVDEMRRREKVREVVELVGSAVEGAVGLR
ncbi:hypothetical protein JCM8547_004683 [Rhodosporidiobolus lusitaniae]